MNQKMQKGAQLGQTILLTDYFWNFWLRQQPWWKRPYLRWKMWRKKVFKIDGTFSPDSIDWNKPDRFS